MHGGGRGRHDVICERWGTRINTARSMDSKEMALRVLGTKTGKDALEPKGIGRAYAETFKKAQMKTQMIFLGPQRAHIYILLA